MLARVFILFLLVFGQIDALAQPANDNCANARELCSGDVVSGTVTGATLEQCFATNPNGCADDNGGGTFCYVPAATVWYKFTTNSVGGNVTVDFTNLSINPDPTMGRKLHAVMLRSENPCEGGNYNYVSACQSNGIVAFSLTSSFFLAPNTTYYIQVDGSAVGPGVTQPAQIDFDVMLSGPGVAILPMKATISASETDLCQFDQEPIDLALTNCSGNPRFEWFYNGVLVYDSIPFPTSLLTESGHLYLKASCGAIACPSTGITDSIFFDVTPIEVDAGEDVLIGRGENVVLSGSGSGTPSWTPTEGVLNAKTYNPTVSPSVTTTYTLLVENDGCSLTDQVVVNLRRPINIPNGFTPNNDGNNDFWEIEFIEQYPDNSVTIYDRAGQVVYRTIGYNNGITSWDGTFKDNPVPVSTYFYVIDLRNGDSNSVFKGPVTIIR